MSMRRESTGAETGVTHQEITVEAAQFKGPGPSPNVPYTKLYRCFEKDNGLLFRLVHDKRHTWAFYNDTEEYTMKVTVTFGNESAVKAQGNTTQEDHNDSGHCTLELTIGPGETQPFMRGEYNGSLIYYDAEPLPNLK